MKVGIMGGTFDPIHNGHLMLGRYARDLFKLDEIWFMPNGTPPHKTIGSIESQIHHRVEMVQAAIADEENFILQTYEIENKETNYSYLTMEHFKEVYPEHEFYFIIGADSLFHIENWKSPERLFQTCIILAAYRNGKNKIEMEEQIAYLNQKYGADIRLLSTPNVDISSSELRQRLKLGLTVDDALCEPVLTYIKEHGLYPFDLTELQKEVQGHQSDKRFKHTLGVMYTAAALAMCHGADVKKALVAGLLHDCAKSFPTDAMISFCEQYKIPISATERENPGLLHAKLGAHLAKTEYGVDDMEILDAICYHTTGRKDMTLLDKIIYIADYIEPNRNQAPNLQFVRELAFKDLNNCLIEILEATLSYLQSGKKVIDPMTEETYQYYKLGGNM